MKFSTFVTRKQHTYPKDKILRKFLVYGDAQEMFISSFYPTFYLKDTCISPTVKHHESLYLMLSMYLPLSFSLTYSDLVPQLTTNAKSQKKAKRRKLGMKKGIRLGEFTAFHLLALLIQNVKDPLKEPSSK